MIIEGNTKKFHQAQETYKYSITNLCEYTLLDIFSHLSEKEISNCSLVCKKWRDLTDNNTLWKAIYQANGKPHIYSQLEPLLNDEILKGREIAVISKITSFLSKIEAHSWKYDNITNKHTSCGNFHFTVMKDERNIEIYEPSSGRTRILKGVEEQPLTHLAVEGPHLFALSVHGVILQWNFLTGELVKEIETEYAKKNKQLSNVMTLAHSLCSRDNFIVQEGCIAILYGCALFQTIFEVITGEDFTEHKIIDMSYEKFSINNCRNIAIKNQFLYGTYEAGIFAVDIKSKKSRHHNQEFIFSTSKWSREYMSIYGRIALVSQYHLDDHFLEIHKFDLQKNEWSEAMHSIPGAKLLPRTTQFLELNNFLILSFQNEGNWNLKCIDMLSNVEVLEIKDLIEDIPASINPEVARPVITPDHIAKIVKAYKQHCLEARRMRQPLDTLASTHEAKKKQRCGIQ